MSVDAAGLPDHLVRFIKATLPTYEAVELLLFLAATPDRAIRPEAIVLEIRPIVLTLGAVREYLELFAANGLLQEDAGVFRYRPLSSELGQVIDALATAHNERPVTLMRTIYS